MRRLLLLALIIPSFSLRERRPGAARRDDAESRRLLDAEGRHGDAHRALRADSPPARASRSRQSYGPSGAQAKAIVAGQPADIAFLSTGLDIDTLADAGLVAEELDEARRRAAIAADSVVAFVVRPGNPKHIHTWPDLDKAGCPGRDAGSVPAPASAKWNVLAAYGAGAQDRG